MKDLKSLFKVVKTHELVLSAVLIIYILTGIKTPNFLADALDTTIGTIVVIILACSLFVYVNPVLGVIGTVAAFELLKRSGENTGHTSMMKYLPSEFKKGKTLNAMNQFPVTLEEQVVRKMAPLSKDLNMSSPSYKPVLDDDIGGSQIQ